MHAPIVICESCGTTMEPDNCIRETDYEHSEFWGIPETRTVYYLICPFCGGDCTEESP